MIIVDAVNPRSLPDLLRLEAWINQAMPSGDIKDDCLAIVARLIEKDDDARQAAWEASEHDEA